MLIAVDVDHLRHVNDAWSRATGDAVLQAVAGVLRAQSRPQDVLARADADLFVVALGGPVSTTRALLVAERLRAAVEGHAWAALGAGLRVTASLGVAARAPGESLDDALARAGAALAGVQARRPQPGALAGLRRADLAGKPAPAGAGRPVRAAR